MDSIIGWMIENWGWGALVVGFVVYVIVEGGLDIVTDIISHELIERRKK